MKYYFTKKDFLEWYKQRYQNADCQQIECEYFNNISAYEEVNAYFDYVLRQYNCYNCLTCCDLKDITRIACLSFYENKKYSSAEQVGLSAEIKDIIMHRLSRFTDLGIY